MDKHFRAIYRNGSIELQEPMDLPDGTELYIFPYPEDLDREFWLQVSRSALDKIWNNEADDCYAALLNDEPESHAK